MNGTYKYDFTTDSSQVYGGTASIIQLAADKWGMPAGDANYDGYINMDDKSSWNVTAGRKDYHPADFNLDGHINNKDINDFWFFNRGFECQVPQ